MKTIAIIGLKGLPAFGGAATVGENIINQLKTQYNFYVYAIETHSNQCGECNGYHQIVLKKSIFKKLNIFFYYLKAAIHCLVFSNYDLIHLHHIDGAFIIPILRLKYKVISTSHAQTYISEKWPLPIKLFFKINERIMLRLSNEVTAVSLQLISNYMLFSTRKVHYIPNGINSNFNLKPYLKENNQYLLFAAGRIIPLKGLHILLEAIKKFKINIPLIVIGDLNQIPSYKEEILYLSKDLNVTFVNLIKEKIVLFKYVRNCKLFIFPSLSENMSIMLLEAASLKTPIICSDIPANTSIFDNREVIFFKTNDSNDLYSKIKYSLDNYQEVKTVGERAYKKVVSNYTWEEISQKYHILYQKYTNLEI